MADQCSPRLSDALIREVCRGVSDGRLVALAMSYVSLQATLSGMRSCPFPTDIKRGIMVAHNAMRLNWRHPRTYYTLLRINKFRLR